MRLFDALKKKKPLTIGILSALAIGLLLPVVLTGFFQNSFGAWFLTVLENPLNTTLYVIYSILFGILVAVQVYNLTYPRVCKDCNTKTGAKTGAVGAGFGFLVGICPACVGLLGLVLPLGVSLTLTYYGWLFMLFAIGIMILSLYFLGGFKRK